MARFVLARMMEMAQRALEILNLAFVVNFLPLGQLQRFQHFFHLIESMFQFVDDAIDLGNGVGNRGSFVRGFRFVWRLLDLDRLLALLGFLDGRL